MRPWDAEAVQRAMQVYLVMGSVNTTQDPVEVLRQAIAGGITLFQFREKGTGALVGEARITLAMRLREVCSQHEVPFIVNDDVELAVAVEAGGVHVGQEDADAALVRARIGDGRMLGVSAHSVDEARRAVQAGADYLGVGPMYPALQSGCPRCAGPRRVAELRAAGIAVPIVGIGGITPDTTAAVMAAGADGVAVISAIAGAADVRAAAAQFAAIVRGMQA